MYFYFILALFLTISFSVSAEDLKLNYGANPVDINGDGKLDLIVKVRWENGNAHSFDKYLISILQKDGYGNPQFIEVPLGESAKYSIRSYEGADCILTDYKFEIDNNKRLKVTKFARDFGKSFFDKQPVTITTYLLKYAHEEYELVTPGQPNFYLKQVSETKTKQNYCDVRNLK